MTGNLATEIFFGASLAGALRVSLLKDGGYAQAGRKQAGAVASLKACFGVGIQDHVFGRQRFQSIKESGLNSF